MEFQCKPVVAFGARCYARMPSRQSTSALSEWENVELLRSYSGGGRRRFACKKNLFFEQIRFLCFINFSSPSKLSELQIRISHAQPDAGEIEAVQKEMEINARAIRHVIKIAIFTFAGLERNALTISRRRNMRLTSRWESRDERKSIERLKEQELNSRSNPKTIFLLPLRRSFVSAARFFGSINKFYVSQKRSYRQLSRFLLCGVILKGNRRHNEFCKTFDFV